MKKILPILLIPALSVSAFAQDAYQGKAVLSKGDGETFVAWVLAATKTSIRYKVAAVAVNFTDEKISDFTTIYLMEPEVYAEAMDLYEGGKYQEAKEKFVAYKEYSKPSASLEDNFHTLSAFYEMECMRKLGEYEDLAAALQNFIKEPLTRDHQLRQLDLYVMWDAVRTESWDRLLIIASERDDEELPDYQRVQVAYCKGLALQKAEKPREALIAYAVAMSADAGASQELVQSAVFNSLQIYHDDEEVQLAITNWGTEDENKGSAGYSRLIEAGALARVYNKFLNRGKPLPENYAKFVKFEA